MSKAKFDHRRRAADHPAPPTPLRQRWSILAAGGLVLVIFIAALAGSSAGLVFARLITEGLLLGLWLLAAAGFAAFVPLPDSERAACLRIVSRIALGLGTIGSIQLCFGLAGGVSRIGGFAIIAIGIVLLLVRARKLTRTQIEEWLTEEANWEWLCLVALPILALAIVAAYAPPGTLWGDEPHGYDVLEYHLQLPREFFELHRVAPLKHNVFSFFPQGVEMHYLLAMELAGGPWAGMYLAQLMHLSMIVLSVVAIYATARLFAGKAAAMLAALAGCAVPWMMLLAPIAYNEGGLLLFATLAIGWCIYLLQEPSVTAAIIAGVFAGFACGTKLTAVPQVLFLVPLLFLAIAWTRQKARAIIAAMVFVIAGSVVFSPWLIRNAVWAHNPVFPEAQNVFGRAHFSPEQSERWHRAHSPTSDQQSLSARLNAAGKQIGIDWRYGSGLLWLAAVVAIAIGFRQPQAKLFAALIVVWLIFWIDFTHLQGRFFVLVIPVAALSLAQSAQQRWQKQLIATLVVLQFCVGCYLDFTTFDQRVGPLRAFLGYEDFKPLVPPQAAELIDRPDAPAIALIGDARAFLYQVPMKRLFYRTVFDVNVKPGQSSADAWLDGVPTKAEKVVDFNELERFARTYYGIPRP